MTKSDEVDLLRGTLDLLLLELLARGPTHGLGIVRALSEATRSRLRVAQGALYPALHRMERKAWLDSYWATTERNKRAKFYALSRRGRQQLRRQRQQWIRYVDVVQLVIDRPG